jgi:hypothetical protein
MINLGHDDKVDGNIDGKIDDIIDNTVDNINDYITFNTKQFVLSYFFRPITVYSPLTVNLIVTSRLVVFFQYQP